MLGLSLHLKNDDYRKICGEKNCDFLKKKSNKLRNEKMALIHLMMLMMTVAMEMVYVVMSHLRHLLLLLLGGGLLR